MKEYWFYLESEIFVFKKKSKILLYNSLSHKMMCVYPSIEVVRLIDKLTDPNELYVVAISSKDLDNKQINSFIHNVRQSYFGDLILKSGDIKPVIIPPILKIHKSKSTIYKDPGFNLGKDILLNINELIIYINGKCSENCEFCKKMNHQFDFCTKNSDELCMKDIEKILNVALNSYCAKLIITGGNIFKHTAFFDLFEMIKQKQQSMEVEFGIHYLNLEMEKYNYIVNSVVNLSVYITFPTDKSKLMKFFQYANSTLDRVTFNFVVKEESELILVQNLIEKYQIEDKTVIKPFYDGKNNRFFGNCVFYDENDIQNSFPSKQELFAKQSFNTYDFGRLIVRSNGDIQANANHPVIGNISENIADIIYKEFTEGKSWFRTRDQAPCNDCVYQWLCPSPSNYEIAIGKPNLCHVKIEENEK